MEAMHPTVNEQPPSPFYGPHRMNLLHLEMFLPETMFPEAEALHFLVVIAERGVAIWTGLQVNIPKLPQIGSDDLV